MILPYYVGVFTPPAAPGRQGPSAILPSLTGEGTKSLSPGLTPTVAAVPPGSAAATLGQTALLLNGDVITYVSPLGTVSPATITVQAPQSAAQSMELVWHGEFDRLFSQYYPHHWALIPTFYAPSDRWQVFKDSAKVRFSCAECGHGWTSMKGRVIFWFNLNYNSHTGVVIFKLYGQQCQKCNNGRFEHAMWYPEEVVKVVGNVYNRVGQCYYGFVRPPLRIDRRQGKPRNQHNAELCQACKEGLCKEEWAVTAAVPTS